MDIGTALVTDGEASEAYDPGECSLDDPAVFSEMSAAFSALAGDAGADPAPGAGIAAMGIVLSLVGVEVAGTPPWPAPARYARAASHLA